MTTQIKCPECGKLFEPTDAFKHELEEKLKLEKQIFEESKNKELELMTKEVTERVRLETQQKVKSEMEVTIEKFKTESSEKEKQSSKLQEQLTQELKTVEELKIEKEKLKSLHDQELEEVKKTISDKAKIEAIEKVAIELKDREDQISNLKKRAEQAEENELQIRKEKRELEEAKQKFELEKQRQLDEERNKIRDQALKEAQEDHQLKDAEKEKKLQEALKMNDDLKRKLEQGSQQSQGEVMELEIEQFLRHEFPEDIITEVKKGERGADIKQIVIDKRGRECGIILWESKNAQWSDAWLKKLREDQRAAGAQLAVLVAANPPEDIDTFDFRENTWITSIKAVRGLAIALRFDLIHIHFEKLANIGKNEKMEVIHQYLRSVEFKHRVEAIVEAFNNLQGDIEKEKRWFNSKWARQEKELRKIVDNTHGMYGELQAVTGRELQVIKPLELPDGDTDF